MNFCLPSVVLFVAYNKKGGARSNKKLVPIHKFLSKIISSKLEKSF